MTELPSDKQAIADGCYFDEKKAEHICQFFEKFLCVSTGRLAGQPLKLLGWQRDFLRCLNGWRRADGSRRFKKCFLAVAKKNSKSFLCSGLALYFGLADGEQQPEVVLAASARDQAEIVYREAKNMVLGSSAIKGMCRVVDSRKKIMLPSGSGYIRVVSSDAGRQEGINASLVVMDELHAHKSRDLYDCLVYSGIARKSPLVISITTAGHDKDSFCFEEWQYARKVLNGDVVDTHLLPIIYSAEGMDYESPDAWRAANPSLGVIIDEEEFRSSFNEAKESPVRWSSFVRYRLNAWYDSDQSWLSSEKWALGDDADFDISDLTGATCYGGLDLSAVSDLTSLSLYFPDYEALLSWSWIPRDNAMKRTEKNHAP